MYLLGSITLETLAKERIRNWPQCGWHTLDMSVSTGNRFLHCCSGHSPTCLDTWNCQKDHRFLWNSIPFNLHLLKKLTSYKIITVRVFLYETSYVTTGRYIMSLSPGSVFVSQHISLASLLILCLIYCKWKLHLQSRRREPKMINTSATLEISGKRNKFEICIYEVSVLELCVFRGVGFRGLCCCSLCFKGLCFWYMHPHFFSSHRIKKSMESFRRAYKQISFYPRGLLAGIKK